VRRKVWNDPADFHRSVSSLLLPVCAAALHTPRLIRLQHVPTRVHLIAAASPEWWTSLTGAGRAPTPHPEFRSGYVEDGIASEAGRAAQPHPDSDAFLSQTARCLITADELLKCGLPSFDSAPDDGGMVCVATEDGDGLRWTCA